MDRLQVTAKTVFPSASRSSSPTAFEFDCASAHALEVYVACTAGAGNVTVALLTAPDADGPFVQVASTFALASGSSDVLGAIRGAGGNSVGGRARITATVSGTCTFEVRAAVWS